MSVNTKMMAGKMARMKLNATADARNPSQPFCKPFTKKAVTSYNGRPSNPGIRTSFEKRMMFRMIGSRRNLTMSFLTKTYFLDKSSVSYLDTSFAKEEGAHSPF